MARDDSPDSTAIEALHALLTEAVLTPGDALPELIRAYAPSFGAREAVCFLADLQQTVLLPFLGRAGSNRDLQSELLPIESTLAGRAYQQSHLMQQHVPQGMTLWLPMVTGNERLGVLAVSLDRSEELPVGGPEIALLEIFAGVLADLITAKTRNGDTIVRLRRESAMGLAAELQWSLLPPLTFASRAVTLAAALEPAYEVAGDTVDYAVDANLARIALFDGMGHGLDTVQFVAIAVAAYRHGRRSQMSLIDTCLVIDEALLHTTRGRSFSTAVLAELDTDTGVFTWVNAGHPEPLLIRNGRLIRTLHVTPRPPLGMDLRGTAASAHPGVGVEQLEPGDTIVLYTDGVTEARSPDGDFFGEARLADLIVRNLAAGLPAPETMRRVVHTLLEHQHGELTDDATLALIQWPTDPQGDFDHP